MRAPVDRTPGTRDRLLDTAERLFAERGFDRASVREITEAAGANLGAVNYHFRSKESLYAEVFSRRTALLRDPVVAAARAVAGIARRRPDEALRAFGRAFLAPRTDRGSTRRLLGLFARELVENCLPSGLLLRELVLPTREAATAIVRAIRPDLPAITAGACARSFIAQLMQIVSPLDARAASVDQQLEHAVRFTVAGVGHIESVPRTRPGAAARPRKR